MRRRLLAISVLMFLLNGCGYSFSGRNAANVGDIYIPFFKDETTGSRAVDLGTTMTDLLVEEFDRDKEIDVYQGLSERSLAKKELLGVVKRIRESVLTRDVNELGEEYRVVVSVSVKYNDIASGKSLWESNNVTGDGNYLLEDGDEGFQLAVEEALGEILDKILDKTIRSW